MHQPPTTFQVDGAVIRQRRMHLGLETSELAERAGISQRYLNHLENGTRTRMRPRRYAALRSALEAGETLLLAPQRPTPNKE